MRDLCMSPSREPTVSCPGIYRLTEELQRRWRDEYTRQLLRKELMHRALEDNDLELFQRILENDMGIFPYGFRKKKRSFWESFVTNALIIWVLGWILILVFGAVYFNFLQ